MDMKKIKKIIAIGILLVVGLYSVWNYFSEDQNTQDDAYDAVEDIAGDEDELVLVEEVPDEQDGNQGQDDDPEPDTTEAQDVIAEPDVEPAHQSDYDLMLESIADYRDIVGVIYTDQLPENVRSSYERYSDDGWEGLVSGQSEGTKAGGYWGNYDDQLPIYGDNGSVLSYNEFDVNNKIQGQSRDAERFVVASDGCVYYTNNHYDSFEKIIE
jgi:hypothetical protein